MERDTEFPVEAAAPRLPSTRPAPPRSLPKRVVIEAVEPEVDGGAFPAKRTVGDAVVVEADVFADGHDVLAAILRWRRDDERGWREEPMAHLGNDRWRASFPVREPGTYRFTVSGWIDRFATWRRDLVRRLEARQDVPVELLVGAGIVESAARRAKGEDAARLRSFARLLGTRSKEAEDLAIGAELRALMAIYADRRGGVDYGKELRVRVERERAAFSSWYELFPRSTSPTPGRHGTFADVERRLEYVERLGFDVVYFPPIHPIGRTHRKGKNNEPGGPTGVADAPGSPWAIGSEDGGHDAIHPELGTVGDFERLVARARELGLEVALDLALQCSPDHPWVRQHPQWFRTRPDGTIQYAENPPKRYQDIFPLDFETRAWRSLWQAIREVVDVWIERGVRIFRVDNPHTKPFAFWEWLISGVHADHPDVVFLSEAFTRPKVMYRLAKLGFSQSYTYFTWRNTKWELTEYMRELTRPPIRDFFRPNFWPNTPDILNSYLVEGRRPAFIARLVLAATLSSNYGIYGPAFELMERTPLAPGANEEYRDSEKYEIRQWDLDDPQSLAPIVARVNAARKENRALHRNDRLRFHHVDNDNLIAYTKTTADLENVVLTVVNLDSKWTQSGWLTLPLEELGIDSARPFAVHDLLDDSTYRWTGPTNYVELRPKDMPAHLFRVAQSRTRRASRRAGASA